MLTGSFAQDKDAAAKVVMQNWHNLRPATCSWAVHWTATPRGIPGGFNGCLEMIYSAIRAGHVAELLSTSSSSHQIYGLDDLPLE